MIRNHPVLNQSRCGSVFETGHDLIAVFHAGYWLRVLGPKAERFRFFIVARPDWCGLRSCFAWDQSRPKEVG